MSWLTVPVDRMTLYQAPIVGVAIARPATIDAVRAPPKRTFVLFISNTPFVGFRQSGSFNRACAPVNAARTMKNSRRRAVRPGISCQEISKQEKYPRPASEGLEQPGMGWDMDAPIPSEILDRLTTFGELLRYLRRRAGLTQTALSIAVGYSDAQIS